ncbi:MAG: NYN domain-containing protein, partial [Rhodospirillales bacterium]|nr:NYN domain-containing protein [Rhodospirillales bacterium]
VSTVKSQPSMVADELRRQADKFIELDDLKSEIGRSTNDKDDDYPAPGPTPADPYLESA